MSKSARKVAMLKLIETEEIETQTELTNRLNSLGFSVTQATVSRDIKELGIIKSAESPHSRSIYIKNPETVIDKFRRIFDESVISVRNAENLIVVKTVSGSANSAAAYIDKLGAPAILGTIAGDDTILVIVESTSQVPAVMKKLLGQ